MATEFCLGAIYVVCLRRQGWESSGLLLGYLSVRRAHHIGWLKIAEDDRGLTSMEVVKYSTELET